MLEVHDSICVLIFYFLESEFMYMSQYKLEFRRIQDWPGTNWNSQQISDKLEFQFQLDISQCKLEF